MPLQNAKPVRTLSRTKTIEIIGAKGKKVNLVDLFLYCNSSQLYKYYLHSIIVNEIFPLFSLLAIFLQFITTYCSSCF